MMAAVSTRLSGTTIKENILDGDVAFKTLSNLVDTYNIRTIPTFFVDQSALAEVLGCEIYYQDDVAASVRTHPVKTREDLARLKVPNPYKDGRLPNQLKTGKLMCKRYPNHQKSGSAGGPFSLAGNLGGLEDVLMNTIADPEFVDELVDFCTVVNIELGKAQLELGCSSFFTGDPSAALLDAKSYARFAAAPIKKMIEELKVPMLLHICGDSTHLIEEMCATGISGISVDSAVDIRAIVPRVPKDVLILGNLDPIGTMLSGTPRDVIEETKALLDKMSDVPNWRFCTGCDLPPDTPLENLNALMEVLDNY